MWYFFVLNSLQLYFYDYMNANSQKCGSTSKFCHGLQFILSKKTTSTMSSKDFR